MVWTKPFRRDEPKIGSSSAVTAVLFHRGDMHHHLETKQGSYIYKSDAANYHEWEFRTQLRVMGKKGDQYADAASRVVEGLRGDAFITGQELGLTKLRDPGSVGTQATYEEEEIPARPSGIDLLIEAMRNMVFPLTQHEARELFRQYTKTNGALARQSGESMTQYVSRRVRCWKLLKELDPDVELSDGHRADMLLEFAGLDRQERIMVQASIGNERDFNKVADALILQHPRIHLQEHRHLLTRNDSIEKKFVELL